MNSIKLELGGKERNLVFGLGFLGNILGHYDMDIAEFGTMLTKNPFKAVPAIIYFAAEYDVRKKGEMVDFTIYDVDDWVEGLENTYANPVIEEMLNVLLDSMKKNVPGVKEILEGPKKK